MPHSIDQAERFFTLTENFRRWKISSSGHSPGGILAGCRGKRRKPSATLHESCVRMMARGPSPNNSMDFPMALCLPELTQTFLMNFVYPRNFGYSSNQP